MYGRLLDGGGADEYDVGFHGFPLVLAWLPLANVAVIVAAMRWHHYSFYAHVGLAVLIIGFTLAGTLHLLIDDWVHQNDYDTVQKVHNIGGLVVVFWLGLQVVTGILARVVQYSPKINPNLVIVTKRIHYISSYLILIVAKFTYINISFIHNSVQGGFVVFILIDLIFLALYLWIKLAYWRLSEEIVDEQLAKKTREPQENRIKELVLTVRDSAVALKEEVRRDEFPLPELKQVDTHYNSESQIRLDSYVIFNDYVYDTEPFKQLHPGGEYLMRVVNKREIDRFMDGSYTAELTPTVRIHDHTKDSMKLCGPPVAKIDRISPMKGINKLVRAKMTLCNRLAKGNDTFIIHLEPTASSAVALRFDGFELKQQIGQYFSVTVGNHKGRKRVTRLYTTSWCMRPRNVDFMTKNFPASAKYHFSIPEQQPIEMVDNFKSESNLKQNDDEVIPFVIKQYPKGKLTQRLLSTEDIKEFEGEIVLSPPMGGGMHYEKIPDSGKVIIACCGTGVLPFCDFVDLLFKRVKILEGSNVSSQIAKNDPLVKEDLIQKRAFLFYCAVRTPFDIPSMTVFQINELCSSRSKKYIDFKSVFKVKEHSAEMKKQFPEIELTSKYFDNSILEHLKTDTISKLYICGSPEMNASIGQLVEKNRKEMNLREDIYHFM